MKPEDLTDAEITRAMELLKTEFQSAAKDGIVGPNNYDKLLVAIWVIAGLLREREAKISESPAPQPQMVAGEINITLAAQRIFEVFCGGPVDWSRHSLNDADDNVFASADWAQAMLYAKAAFAAAPAEAIAAATTDLWVGSAGAVPEDIRQAAQKAWDDAMALTSDAQSEMVIAQAILAERQAPPLQHVVGAPDLNEVYVIPRDLTDEEWAEVKYNVDRKADPDIPLWRIQEVIRYANFIAGTRGLEIVRAALSAPEAER